MGKILKMVTTTAEKDLIASLPNSAIEMNVIVRSVYDEYNKALQSFLKCKIKSNEDVEDVAQEVYLRLVRHPRLTELEPSFALLSKIASDVIKDRIRKRIVREKGAHIPIDDFEIMSAELSPEQALNSKEGVLAIRLAIKSLNRKSRQAIILHRFRNMTYEEIGNEMGISISMVRKHIVKALQKISREVEAHYENRNKKVPKTGD